MRLHTCIAAPRLAYLLSLVFACYAAVGFAQKLPSDYWHDGYVTLPSNDTLKGKIKYDLENEVVQLDRSGKIQAYSPQKIKRFTFIDAVSLKERTFIVQEYTLKNDFAAPFFFELLLKREVSLLCREKIIISSAGTGVGFGFVNTYRSLDFDFFAQKGDRIKFFKNKKKEILTLFEHKKTEIEAFAKNNKLGYINKEDIRKIFEYYNNLIAP